jgi:3-methyl-2-oxobutanoate hydroxymethyltransferase
LKKVTINTLRKMKQAGERITMLTAYDASFARLFDKANIDVLLVGDSLGNVIQGQKTTLPVTLEQMIYHCAAVARGVDRAHIVGDMPFGSYQASVDEAVKNAMRLVAEGGCESVKLEGGAEYADVVKRIVRAGVPVMGHIGLTPQSVHKLGGYVVQGKTEDKAARLLADAKALEAAGCYSIVLEAVPADLGARITRELSIPTIGIGAGVECDGQVLVCYDLLGVNAGFAPKFVKKYLDLAALVGEAVGRYRDEVRAGAFPAAEHSFASEAPREQQRLQPAAAVQAAASALPLPSTGPTDVPADNVLRLYSVPGRE